MRLLTDEEEATLWDYVYSEFNCEYNIAARTPITPARENVPYRVYGLKRCWIEEQEKIAGELLRRSGVSEMYALNWQHDCFLFSTDEDIPYWLNWYDLEREVMVYFPSYYPDGDYHFFLSTDLSEGFLGHPWRKEMCVFGNRLIQAFDEHKQELDMEDLQP